MKKIILVLLMLTFLSQICYAKTDEWMDKDYSFKTIKNVFISPPIFPKDMTNPILRNQINDALKEKLKLSNVKIISYDDILEAISADGINISDIYAKDQKQALQIFMKYISQKADVTITTNILSYGYGSEYRDGYTSSNTTYEDSYVYAPNGSTYTVRTPKTTYSTTPGGNVTVAYTYVTWNIIDTKTNRIVLARDDFRETDYSRLINTTPEDMLKRNIKDFSKKFNKLHEK